MRDNNIIKRSAATAGRAAVFLLLFWTPLSAGAATLRVDANGVGDYGTIAEAVAAGTSVDTVLVAPGIYAGSGNRGIVIGSAGPKVIVSEAGASETVIDCEHQGRAFEIVTSQATIQGFTFIHGASSGRSAAGSAIYLTGCGSLIEDCVFSSNGGPNGALAEYGVECTSWNRVDGCVFLGNDANGIYAFGTLRVTDCEFTENGEAAIRQVTDYNHRSRCEIRRCGFRGNFGAGVDAQGSCKIEDSVFVGNGDGAVVLGDQCDYDWIRNCTIVDNSSASHAAVSVPMCGVIYGGQDCGCPGILACVIAFNDCQGAVGCTEYTEPTVRSCVIYGNTGGDDICGVCSDNFFVDPLLCDVAVGDVAPCEDSPCLGADTPDGSTIGAYCVAGCGPCGDTPVKDTSWGAVKARWR